MALYLKTLELQGFKSFAPKTRLEFVDGITGIVGPNGCGKSNVVESLKWVLGEQSAKSLRGDKMEDIIFNGSKGRSPMGMAEVNLTFSNESHWLPIEYQEVTVGRRIFRSGEGQYSLNRSRIRLKDVVELFLDTGVGRDSYAIFGQNRIDKVLSDSPMARRGIIEDFAGISKFKFRKEEAQRKLNYSNQNLERLNDIIIELEKEVTSLEKQASNARHYHELRENLKNLELKFHALRVKNIENEIMNKCSQKKSLENKIDPLIEDIKHKEESVYHTESDIMEREKEVEAQSADFNRMEKELAEIQSRIKVNRDRKGSLEKQIQNNEKRLQEGELRLQSLNTELEDKMRQFDDASEEKEVKNDYVLEIQSGIDRIYSDIKRLETEALDQSKTLGFDKIVNRDHISRYRQDLTALQTHLENARQTLEEKFENFRDLETEHKTRKETLSNIEIEKESLKKQLTGIVENIETVHKREKEIRLESKEFAEEIKNLQVELKSMDQVIMSSLEKQSAEIKVFRENKSFFDNKLEDAISSLNHAINESQSGNLVKEAIVQLQNIFEEYRNQYENILGILYSDEGTYTRKENLQNHIEDYTARISRNETEQEELRKKGQELQAVRADIQTSYHRHQYDFDNLKKEMNRIDQEMNSLQESQKSLELQINSFSSQIQEHQESIEAMMGIVDSYEENMQSIKEERNQLYSDLQKKKIESARVEEQYKSLSNEIKRIKNQILDIQKMRENFEQDRDQTLDTIEALDEQISEDEIHVDQLRKSTETLKDELIERKLQIQEMYNARKTLESQIKLAQDTISKMETSIARIEQSVSERKNSLQEILENAQNTYSVDIREIQVSKEDHIDGIHAEINRIRDELTRLGDVNLLAIEQYQNEKERLEFLVGQREDVQKAIEDIEALIAETNAKSIEQFSRAFEDIRKAFKKIFSRLFEGGRADLILIDKNDILNSGIDILAEPPGKKFQSISLLSGGERALVAIAVIFAILYLKPTPFVVLDELDAPLDDDNIERFKAILKDFKQTTQFVVVSHSKSTLEICDALYGVTMEELGVSKIINVAFNDAQLLLKT